jgi:two-component system LytT family sensor kinase
MESKRRRAPTGQVTLWLAVAAFWTFVALLYAGQIWWLASRPGERINVRMALTWQLTYYLAWIPFTLVVWRVTRNWLPEVMGWGRWIAAHLLFAFTVGFLHSLVVVAIARPLAPEPVALGLTIVGQFRGRMHLQILVYAAIAGMGQALSLYQRFRERQIAAARLEAELSAARLEALRAQLQPHFLFNSLHSIASLARSGDNAGVVRLIAGFSELLRHVLDNSHAPQSLGEEMRLVEQYLDIQRVRFGDRLSVTVDLAPEAAGARVPPLIVQPLVENALRHGLSSRIEPGHVSVRATADHAWTTIEVEDDGAGLPAGFSIGATDGTGLRNLASRLSAEFGDRQSLTLLPRAGGGAKATVRVPFAAP